MGLEDFVRGHLGDTQVHAERSPSVLQEREVHSPRTVQVCNLVA